MFFSCWLPRLLLVVASCFIGSVPANSLNYHFRYLTITQGLPQNNVYAVLRDQFGFMWFGTGNGLSRFDGYSFNNFYKPQLPSNFVNALAETNDNLIWVGTSMGLAYLDQSSGTFHVFELGHNFRNINVGALYVDAMGRLWVGTSDHGLFILAREGDEYAARHFYTGNSNLQSNSVTSFLNRDDGRVFIGTYHGIAVFDEYRQSFYQFDPALLGTTVVYSMYECIAGDLWVGTFNGVWVSNQVTGRAEWFLPNPSDPTSLNHARVNHIAQDFRGNIYIGTLGGVNVYQPQSNNFTSLPHDSTDGFSLNSMFVNVVYVDDKGNVWIGTDRGGINRFSLYQKPFHFIKHDPDESNSLSTRTVNSLYAEDNILWIGTAGGGLNRLDRSRGHFEHFIHNPLNNTSIPSNYVTAIYRVPNGELMVGTWGGGLATMYANGTFTYAPVPVASAETGFQNVFVSSLAFHPGGYLLVGTEGGIAVLDVATGLYIPLQDQALGRLRDVGCLMVDNQLNIWIGTRNGLYMAPAKSVHWGRQPIIEPGDLLYFREGETVSQGSYFPSNYIISLHQDAEGNIWAGTHGDGIVKIENHGQDGFRLARFTRDNGLSNDVVYAIQQDEAGIIWASTEHGLARLNPSTGVIDNFFTSDGLVSDQFYWSASFRTAAGEIFFGSVNGVIHFFPGNFPLYPHQPVVTVAAVNVFNSPVGIGQKRHGREVYEDHLSRTNEIFLSYRDNVFSIDFTALDFLNPGKMRYRYMLEGVDSSWVELPLGQRSASYTNLKGGTYTFRVMATNYEGLWNGPESQLLIHIRPPFWQTTWFLVVFMMVLVAGVLFYIKYHTRRLLLEKQKLERVVSFRTAKIEEQNKTMQMQSEELRKANSDLKKRGELIEGQKRELEDMNREIIIQHQQLLELNKEIESITQARMKFFTNISHEFRTPLTLITAPLERLLKEIYLPGPAHGLLELVQRNARRLGLLIDQLLMFRKLETGKVQVRITNQDINTFLDDIFHAFDVLADHKGIDYKLDNGLPRGDYWYDPDKLEIIFYNLVSNAFKYTPKGGVIVVSFGCQTLTKNNEQVQSLVLEVADSGPGIRPDLRERVFDRFYRAGDNTDAKGSGIGLALTRELADVLNGSIVVMENKPNGCRFILTIPCSKESFPGAELNEMPVFDLPEFENKVQAAIETFDETPLPEEHTGYASDETVVLVVEDNKELAAFIANSLTGSYRILLAANGKIGYEMARKRNPDLIISDVMMPEMDGIEMCRQIKGNLFTSHVPVIMLSAKALLDDQLQGLQTGADDYIAKPFNVDILRAKVRNVIESRKKMKLMFATTDIPSQGEVPVETLDGKFMAKAYEVLEEWYVNPDFSVVDFADKMFVSRSLLYKKIKALLDLSPNDFITMYRLKKALPLLNNKTRSVNEVAYSVGFNDPKYFSRVFKKYYRKTPSEYCLSTIDEAGVETPGG